MPLRPIFIGLLLSFILSGPTAAMLRIDGDMGGPLGEYLLRFAKIRDSGEQVVIDGSCFSACTLVTAFVPKTKVCITPRARLGFHASWFENRSGAKVISAAATQVLYEMYPPIIKTWITRKGGLGSQILLLQGAELASIYRYCN
jgi:hypothetical protein